VVATLVATMGDSSFVLLAADPLTALVLHGGLFATGLATGAVVDAIGFDPRRPSAGAVTGDGAVGSGRGPGPTAALPGPRPSTVGAQAAVPGLTGRPSVRIVPPSLVAFWALLGVSFLVAVPTVLQLVPDETFDIGPVPTRAVLGAVGAVVCVGVVLLRWRRRASDGRACRFADRPRDVLLDAARETAVVTTWVVVAFVGYETLVAVTGLDLGRLPTLGLIGVVVGAALGLIPGCGPQLVLTGLYAQGALPLSVLVANALSQDGDALFPLLASDRRSAVIGTAISALPGLVVGGILVAFGQ
jgi:hypothetical protein